MGRKLDLSGLTDNEAEHVLQVVQRDMRLRKKEEERLSELKQELDEEGSRCLLLSRQSRFNQRCCIRCCAPFTFLLNPKRQCRDCRYNVCKACRVYNKRDKAWLCSACQKSRLLKTQSLEWFYTNVRSRFKRFGSAKVLKTLYKKHLAEHGALTELTEGSAYEDSICNEGSVCGSDSAFYRQSEEHSMAETLSVALRVAGEAIDEAISKAEFDTTNQEKQNEAHYLRQHRGELIEELAKTIVQKIISRRKSLAEMKPEYHQDWILDRIPPCSSLNHEASLWRSRSAFSLLDNDLPNLNCGVSQNPEPLQGLKKEGGSSALSTWRSVDRLDNAMLKSPDGNWIALQSAQLSRPSLLTKRKSLVYSALEKESGVVSAYEGMGSDNEGKSEPDNPWGAALLEFQRKMADSNFNLQDSQDVTSCHSDEAEPMIPSPPTGHHDSIDDLLSDSEVDLKPNKPLLALYKKRIPQEIRRPTSSCRTSIIDVNFNPEEPGEKNSEAVELEVGKVRRLRKTRRNKKEKVPASYLDNSLPDNQSQHASDEANPDTLSSGAATPEPSDLEGDATAGEANQRGQELPFKLQEQANEVSISRPSTREDELDGWRDGEEQRDERREGGRERDQEEEEMLWMVDRGRTEDEKEEEERTNELREGSERIKNQLYRLVSQSSLTYLSSTDDELDGMGQSEEDRETDVVEETKEQKEKRMEALTFTLCELEKQVGANQFSSTEDELDRAGLRDGEQDTGEDGQKEELAAKLCRLASQVSATQFSSTDDELDSTGRGEEEEEEEDEGTLWKMEAENAVQVAPLRDLVSLVSASQFSSTEDELDRVGEDELERNKEVSKGDAVLDSESAEDREQPQLMTTEKGEDVETNDKGRGSDSDMNMFYFEVGSEGDKVTDASNVEKDIKNKESSEGTATAQNVSDTEKVECVQQGKTEAEESEKKDYVEEELIEDKYEDERLAEEVGEVEVSTFLSDGGKEAVETQGLKIEVEAERMKERIEERITTGSGEAGVPQENILPCKREAERSEETDGEEKQAEEKMRGFREGIGRWDTAKSDEEDVEFDRIISSMLMMSVEEIQVDSSADTAKDRFGELGTNGRAKIGGETANREKTDVQSTQASKETEELGSRGDKMKPEFVAFEGERDDLERPGENVIEQNEREVCRQQEAMNRNAQQETEKEDQERPAQQDLEEECGLALAISEKPEETDEAKWTHERMDVDQEEQEETSERMAVKEQMMKRQGDSAEESEQRECERKETKDGNAGDEEQSAPSDQEDILSPEEIQNRYSAVSLRSITTEVLKVLNATEELLQGAEGGDGAHRPCAPSLPPNTNPKKLDQQFSRLEENVYVAAGTVYSLEVELGDLEECARGISGTTSDSELSFLEEQVASAAAKVQQSELQISDISARIAALRSAGLNVDPQSRFTKARTIPVMPITLDSSRQLRRRLPAPPMKDDKDA
ncbi:rab effector MyRIP isoform X2 [Myripristis murdjan]|uniref:rab effector MyRIP isoform X2 n=1 Tax=Myripristis murdjan TaxID=586833 RepID=UPI0011762971|nr:rab effector MyRIP-like isoform X2 [Myripristis murdjan]